MSEAPGYTLEHHMRVYDDKHGWFVTVRPDSDTGDLCEIAWNDGDDDRKDERTVMIPWPMAKIMARAILEMTEPRP